MGKKSASSAVSRSVTLSDVARLAGVSLPTASRILNPGVRGATPGTPESRARVLDAAERLGYVVNAAAQATAAGASRAITLIVSDLDDFGATTMISGVMHAAESRGLSVSVRATRDIEQREVEIVSALRGERHRGVIVAASRSSDFDREARMSQALRALEATGTRVVVIGRSELPFSSVVTDNRAAAAAFAEQVCAGRTGRIMVVAGPADQLTSRDRLAGFVEGAARVGATVTDEDILHEEFSRNGGFRAASVLVDRGDEPVLVAAMSDAMAVGFIAGLRERGIDARERFPVTGFDNVPMIGDLLPEFDTVAVPLEQFGEAAVGLLLEEGDELRQIVLEAFPIIHSRSPRAAR